MGGEEIRQVLVKREQLLGKLVRKGYMGHFARNVQLALTRMSLDLIELFVSHAQVMSFLIELFILMFEVVLLKLLALTNVSQKDIICQIAIQLLKN